MRRKSSQIGSSLHFIQTSVFSCMSSEPATKRVCLDMSTEESKSALAEGLESVKAEHPNPTYVI